MDIKLCVFDCDGTLVDSQDSIVRSMRAAFEACGMTPPDRQSIRRVVGLPLARAAKGQFDKMIQIGKGELDKSGVAELTFPGRSGGAGKKKAARKPAAAKKRR